MEMVANEGKRLCSERHCSHRPCYHDYAGGGHCLAMGLSQARGQLVTCWTMADYPLTASCREGLRRRALMPCLPSTTRRKWVTGGELIMVVSEGFTSGSSSSPGRGISCVA